MAKNQLLLSGEKLILLACADRPDEDLVILPLSQAAALDKPIQILPYGEVKSKKGTFLVDEAAIKAIIATFEGETNDVPIDYEHQTLEGVVAPAAGWIKQLIDKGKDGLYAVVEWTAKARQMIVDKEYKYFSPVVGVRKADKRAVYLHSGGLTNTPAIDGMEPLANKRGLTPNKEDIASMEFLKKLAALLGLAETATEEEITTAIKAIAEKAQAAAGVVANKAVLTLLGLPDAAKEEDVKTAITALKNPAALVVNKELLALLGLPETAKLDDAKGAIIALKNPSGQVSVTEFKALQDKLALRDRDDLVELALKSGKVAPASKPWAEEYALKDPSGFKAFLEKAPVVVPLEKLPDGDKLAQRQAGDEAQLVINKSLGISDEDFKKYGGAE